MGQAALETALNELKRALLLAIFFAGQVIYDIDGLVFISFSLLSQIRATLTGFFGSPLQ